MYFRKNIGLATLERERERELKKERKRGDILNLNKEIFEISCCIVFQVCFVKNKDYKNTLSFVNYIHYTICSL